MAAPGVAFSPENPAYARWGADETHWTRLPGWGGERSPRPAAVRRPRAPRPPAALGDPAHRRLGAALGRPRAGVDAAATAGRSRGAGRGAPPPLGRARRAVRKTAGRRRRRDLPRAGTVGGRTAGE